MAYLSKADNAKSLITNNPLASNGLSITLTGGTGAKFPQSGQFVVTIWDSVTYSDPGDDPAMEKILCDSISTDTITVNTSGRGYDGTSAASHAQGQRIAVLMIKKHLTDIEAIASQDGWIAEPNTPAFSSLDGSLAIINIPADVTGKYSPGMRFKCQQSQALTAYWPLDANSTDTKGGFNGTDTNISYAAGKFSNAAGFNGTTSKITIADNAALKPTGEFTLGGWFKTSTTGTAKWIFQSWSANTAWAGIRLFVETTNKLTLDIGKNTGTVLGTDYTRILGTTTVTDNAWHNVVVSFRNNYVQVYLDGKLEMSGFSFAPAYAATNYVRIGVGGDSGSDFNFMNGQIDDLYLINGYALDDATILAQYNAQVAQGTGNITITKHGIIQLVGAFSGGNTPLTIWGGTDHSIQNATISNPFFSMVKYPFGFDSSPAKWTVEVSDAVDRLASEANLTWTLPSGSSLNITIPIGTWNVMYHVGHRGIGSGSSNFVISKVTLSTTTNSETDSDLTSFLALDSATSGVITVQGMTTTSKVLALAVKTVYNILHLVNTTTAGTTSGTKGSDSKGVVRAVCAYL